MTQELASTFVATKSDGTRLFKIRYLKSKHYLLLVFAQKYNQSIGTVFIANIYLATHKKKRSNINTGVRVAAKRNLICIKQTMSNQ